MNSLLDFLQDPLNLLTISASVAIALLVFLFVQFIRWITQDHLAATAPDESDRNSVAEGLAAQLPQFAASRNSLDRDLRRAGLYQRTARRDYLAGRNGLILLTLIITGIIAVVIGPERETLVLQVVAVGILVASMCWAIPRLVLRQKGNKRIESIRRALPGALDMITMCMTGGLSFERSLDSISSELGDSFPELATELKFVAKQSEMSSTTMALEQLARRVDTEETRTIAALVNQGERLGTGLVPSIQEYADSTRIKWRQMADERAGKAAVRLLLPVAFCLLPSIFILMWGPSVLELWTFLQQFEGAGDINITDISSALNSAPR
jgi:tight adherence protein C